MAIRLQFILDWRDVDGIMQLWCGDNHLANLWHNDTVWLAKLAWYAADDQSIGKFESLETAKNIVYKQAADYLDKFRLGVSADTP